MTPHPVAAPIRVALTGGIATGKSTVVRTLVAHDVPVVDADVVARRVVEPGTPGLAAIEAAFGPDVIETSGALDRKALAAIVFGDAERRRVLEAIVHPRVREAIEAWFAELAASGCPLGVADIPLLFEAGRARDFDRVVVVACEPEVQRARLMARDGLSGEDADRRLAAQWPLADKVATADAVVRTDGTLADTERRAIALVSTLKSWASAPASARAR